MVEEEVAEAALLMRIALMLDIVLWGITGASEEGIVSDKTWS
jgi:hypothetical protein